MSVPSAPQITVRPLATSGALQFYWTAPASDGGSAITGYTLSCSGLTSQSVGASTYTYQYTGLTNGTDYTFSITAENANGSSAPAVFRTVQPGGQPGPVQGLAVSRSAAPAATLSWTAPISDGGATIRGYAVTATSTDPTLSTINADVLGSGTSATVTGLTSGAVYNYTVNAVNDAAYSTAASSGLHSMTETSYEYPINGDLNYWGGIACDISGTKVLAATGQPGSLAQPLYRSNNGGVTWKETVTSVTLYRQWRKCASSADGTKLVAVVGASGGLPYRSTDSGATWTELTNVTPTIALTWTGIACSADGTILFGAGNGTSIRFSSTSGSTWVALSSGLLGWSGFCCSANGQILVACSSTFISISTDTGANWTQQAAAGSRGWAAIACSSDGTKIVSCASDGTIYRTSDTGANWSAVLTVAVQPASNIFTGIACSADGTRIYATTRYAIYVSTDSGTTWERKVVSWSRLTTYIFNHITCSADGMTVYATKQNGNIWKSDNGGATWRELASPRLNQEFISCASADGMIQYFSDQTPTVPKLYKSTDKGTTWTGIVLPGSGLFRGVCCTPDGSKVAVTTGGDSGTAGYVWTSTDGGATFTRQDGSGARNWRAIACDISGTKFVAANNAASSYLYTSTDSGVTWTERTTAGARSWYGVACSADGSKIIASTSSDTVVYVSVDSGATWTPSVTTVAATNVTNVACTPDFSKLFVSSTGLQRIYVSTDGGLNFTSIYSGRTIRAIGVSSDGTKIVGAADFGTGSVLSTDSGANWITVPNTIGKNVFGAAISADGSVAHFTVNGGGGPVIYRLFG